jgi:hypothetical protein
VGDRVYGVRCPIKTPRQRGETPKTTTINTEGRERVNKQMNESRYRIHLDALLIPTTRTLKVSYRG